MVGNVLAGLFLAYIYVERLGLGFPLVATFKGDKVITLEAFYYLEFIGDVVVRELCRLLVREGSSSGKAYVIPINICF